MGMRCGGRSAGDRAWKYSTTQRFVLSRMNGYHSVTSVNAPSRWRSLTSMWLRRSTVAFTGSSHCRCADGRAPLGVCNASMGGFALAIPLALLARSLFPLPGFELANLRCDRRPTAKVVRYRGEIIGLRLAHA